MLKELLESKKCFKLVCGAGNEDAQEVEKLVTLYSYAGCKFFDLSAKPEIVDAAKKALQGREGYLCVSVGIKGDPHIQKAQIDYTRCIECHKCEEICPQKTISYCKINSKRCIGCGKCFSVCNHDAISFVSEDKDLGEILPPLINKGIDCIELHTTNENNVLEKWDYINSVYKGILSVCISRGDLSDSKMIELIKQMITKRPDYTTIVQADGFPMSGENDDYKTTLQAIATAEIVQNAKMPSYIMLSGGTNSKTAELAKMCGINYNGIAIGTYARNIVRKYIERDDFLTNKYIFEEALNIAKNLVNKLNS